MKRLGYDRTYVRTTPQPASSTFGSQKTSAGSFTADQPPHSPAGSSGGRDESAYTNSSPETIAEFQKELKALSQKLHEIDVLVNGLQQQVDEYNEKIDEATENLNNVDFDLGSRTGRYVALSLEQREAMWLREAIERIHWEMAILSMKRKREPLLDRLRKLQAYQYNALLEQFEKNAFLAKLVRNDKGNPTKEQ